MGPGCTDKTLLSAIASALHTSTAPITGQLSAAVEKNPGVWLNTSQPLCKAFIVTDEDIRYGHTAFGITVALLSVLFWRSSEQLTYFILTFSADLFNLDTSKLARLWLGNEQLENADKDMENIQKKKKGTHLLFFEITESCLGYASFHLHACFRPVDWTTV